MPPRLARIGREEMRQTKRGTGYFFSDQHILSTINPKYDDLQTLRFEFLKILCESLYR